MQDIKQLLSLKAMANKTTYDDLEWWSWPNISDGLVVGQIFGIKYPNGKLEKITNGISSEWDGEFPKFKKINQEV